MSLAVPVHAGECTSDIRRLAAKYGVPTRDPRTDTAIPIAVLCDHLKFLAMNPTRAQLTSQVRAYGTPGPASSASASSSITKAHAERTLASISDALARIHKMRGGSGASLDRRGPFCGPSGGAPPGTFPVTNAKQAAAARRYASYAPKPSGVRACVDLVEEHEFRTPRTSVKKMHKHASRRKRNSRRRSARKSRRSDDDDDTSAAAKPKRTTAKAKAKAKVVSDDDDDDESEIDEDDI